ncbi:hypothetical protein D9613_002467 [Agrocybe pediades]|uniref:Uncharacterized protein n=1 Tax=Agrocybe pediades TaxID=84607 RepID=A0A8H4QPY8_9AGAR|nr:hypothetical protein D9613_002467 [Agrocybe pediades]
MVCLRARMPSSTRSPSPPEPESTGITRAPASAPPARSGQDGLRKDVIPQNIVSDSLLALLREHIPGFDKLAMTRVVFDRALAVIKENIHLIIGTLLSSVGVVVLVPSLTVAIVNLIGFTADGVLAGSIAAFVQSLVYGGSTRGLFSILQSFGATATISPVGLAIGGALLVAGGVLANNARGGNSGGGGIDIEDDKEDNCQAPVKSSLGISHRKK